MNKTAQWVLAMAGGLLWATCFSRQPWVVVSLVALLPLFLLLKEPSRRRRFLLGWLHGTVFWLASIPWIAHTLSTYGQLPWPLSVFVLLLLASYLGSYHGVFLLVGGRIWRQREGGLGRLLTFTGLPALWVVLEAVQGALFGGFPWNQAAYAWTEVPGALPVSAWIGAAGVSFLVLIVATGVAVSLQGPIRLWGLVGILLPVVVLAMGGRWAVPELPRTSASPPSSVRIIQPNIATSMTVDWPKIREDYERVLTLSQEACDASGALLVWPESAAWPFRFSEEDPLGPLLKQDLETLVQQGCPVLFNSVYEEVQIFRNSAFLLEPSGRVQRYDKRHLVPFGEFVPLRTVLPFINSLARNVGDFQPADELQLLDWGEERIGMGICYEMIFPAEVAASVRQGATILATMSNDAWYGDSAARAQHLRAARFRAAESRRPLLRAALNGISALVGADGRIVDEIGPDVAGVISGRIEGRADLSPFSRWPWVFTLICWLLAAFAIIPRRRNEP